MVVSLTGLRTKNGYAGEDPQQFPSSDKESEVGVGRYQSTALSCIVRCHYQATASEDKKRPSVCGSDL
jgi:hypothetical protein